MSDDALPPQVCGRAEVVAFWRESGPALWFKKDTAFDRSIGRNFAALHHAAARGKHDTWAAEPEGALALLLLLDQFPRNLWRNSAHAFATDPKARRIATEAIAAGHDRRVELSLRPFFYLPFTHSEDPSEQERSVLLSEALGREGADTARWARLHRDIIVRFGRFPHRNACLGRLTTPEEQAFLDGGGFSG